MPNPVQFAQIVVADVANGATMPAGSIINHGCAPGSPPSGWLLCNGSAISRTTYAALFTAISTRFGTGDGSTTFNVPNLIAKYPVGIATAATAPGATGGAVNKSLDNDGGSHDTTGVHISLSGGSLVVGAQTNNGIPYANGTIADIRPPYLELTPLIKT